MYLTGLDASTSFGSDRQWFMWGPKAAHGFETASEHTSFEEDNVVGISSYGGEGIFGDRHMRRWCSGCLTCADSRVVGMS
jgi:hypothetical protein